MRTAVFGDVGGHREPFEALLTELGVDVGAGTIPDDVTVVQVGDLVHRGPDSPGVIDLVERFIEHPRWVQLVGNHEAQYLRPNGRTFEWPKDDELDARRGDLLRQWFEADLMRVAHATPPGPDGVPFLATHAGVTLGFARSIGADLSSAISAAESVNDTPRSYRSSQLWEEGMMMSGRPDVMAGPLWSESSHELSINWYWAGANCPPAFHQVIGHSSPMDWRNRVWRGDIIMRGRSRIIEQDRHVRMSVNDYPERYIWAIDPGHGRYPTTAWRPLIIEHEE